jgi:GTPase SAR1 family protein
MLEEDTEVAIKMVVVENGAVGKSSMTQSFYERLQENHWG